MYKSGIDPVPDIKKKNMPEVAGGGGNMTLYVRVCDKDERKSFVLYICILNIICQRGRGGRRGSTFDRPPCCDVTAT